MQTNYNTRVLRTYIDAIIAPRIVAIKQSILSSTGIMTTIMNQSGANVQAAIQAANNSANSATASQNSANDSQNYANEALNYANQSLAHANDSQNSANNSASSATASQNSANASQNSATASETSRQAADGVLNTMQSMIYSMNKVWLGVQSSDPTKDKNGDALVPGTEYYNSTTNHVRVYRSDGQWHDQDESTENEMNNAAISASQAAGSASSAANSANEASNAAAQAVTNANNAATSAASSQDHANASQASANSASNSATSASSSANTAQTLANGVNDVKNYMDKYWLGSYSSAPSKDRDGNDITPGAWYFDTTQNKTYTWNGSNWIYEATQTDIDNAIGDFVKIDGSNQMTGPLQLNLAKLNNTNGTITEGVVAYGNAVASGRWNYSPVFTARINSDICRSYFGTVNDTQLSNSYALVRHIDYSGNTQDFQFRNDGVFIASSDVWAGPNQDKYFRGKAIWSANADVAEMYKSKVDFPKGTIVSISSSDDPDQELDLCIDRSYMFGVVSTSPGALLNSGIDGVPVALEGRVPTRVIGKVKKGQKIYLSDKAGVGTSDLHLAISDKHIGFALSSNDNVFESIVEVALRF